MKQKQKPRSGGFAKQTVFVNENMKTLRHKIKIFCHFINYSSKDMKKHDPRMLEGESLKSRNY